jgi:hypothetical protein
MLSWLHLVDTGERGDDKESPLRPEPSVLAVVIRFAE